MYKYHTYFNILRVQWSANGIAKHEDMLKKNTKQTQSCTLTNSSSVVKD